MAKQLKDILGTRSVKTVPGNLGKDPGVDYEPKAGDEQKFVAMHVHQKHEYPHDNEGMFTGKVDYALDKAINARLGYTQKEAEKAAFTAVKEETLDELSTDLLHRAAHKAAKVAMTDVQGRSGPIFKKRAAQANKFRAKGMEQEKQEKAMKEEVIDEAYDKNSKAHQAAKKTVKGMKGLARVKFHPDGSASVHTKGNEHVSSTRVVDQHHDIHGLGYNRPESAYKKSSFKKDGLTHNTKSVDGGHVIHIHEEALDEVLTKSTTAGETIHDFVHSKNPKFAGKSKEKRKEMALAAYYAKQRNESVQEDLAVPLLGSTYGSSDIAKNKTDDTQSEIDMVRAELKAIANKTMHMLSAMPADHHIEPWVQSKIAAAKEMIGSVHDYMMYSDENKEEDEQMDTPMTFPNMSVDVNTGQNV